MSFVAYTTTLMSSTLSKPVPVRFHPETQQKLDAVAERFGIKKAELIRLAVDKSLTDFSSADHITITRRRSAAK
jgi:predicted DNA-binding protein